MSKLITTTYNIDKKIGIKIAVVADLHDTNPKIILEKLKKEKPDLILVPGDLFERTIDKPDINEKKFLISYKIAGTISRSLNGWVSVFPSLKMKDDKNIKYGRIFLRKAKNIAPVFVSNGNHEMFYLKNDLKEFDKQCQLLLNEDIEIILNNQKINIGGLSSDKNIEWLKNFSKKEGYKILLNHHPEYYEEIEKVTNKNIDLIISGHAHGGQWNLFGKPIFAPGAGIFPKYVKGIYDNKLVVSAGCSNSVNIPRINNPKELVIINI